MPGLGQRKRFLKKKLKLKISFSKKPAVVPFYSFAVRMRFLAGGLAASKSELESSSTSVAASGHVRATQKPSSDKSCRKSPLTVRCDTCVVDISRVLKVPQVVRVLAVALVPVRTAWLRGRGDSSRDRHDGDGNSRSRRAGAAAAAASHGSKERGCAGV
jgi:hypothetical protein